MSTEVFLLIGTGVFLALMIALAYWDCWHARNYLRVPVKRANECKPGAFMVGRALK